MTQTIENRRPVDNDNLETKHEAKSRGGTVSSTNGLLKDQQLGIQKMIVHAARMPKPGAFGLNAPGHISSGLAIIQRPVGSFSGT
jgi:hypothetical protein